MIDWVRNLFSKAAVSFAKTLAFTPVWVRHAFMTMSFDKIVREGYKKNSAVSACATTLQLTFPEPPLLAGTDEDGRLLPDYKHPIMKLFKNPNPDMGWAEFMQFVIAYTSIGGNCYIWKQRAVNGTILHLWPFSDAQFTPIPGRTTADGLVWYYEYDAGDGHKVPISKDDIIHWKWMIDPQNPSTGIGAIAFSAREVERDNEATSYIFALLKNNAVPPVVITLEEDDDSTQEEIDAMGKKWVAKHSQGQPAFISAGMKVEQMGYDLNKLAGESLADIPETRIAASFHVPPSVAGLNVGVKRSDYGDTAARKAFTEQTLMALWRSFASEVCNGLRTDFNLPANFTLWFDLRNVGALQEQKKDMWTRVTEAWKGGLLTRGQAKQELGMKAEPGDDVYMVSLATEFVPAGQVVVRNSGDGKSRGRVEQKARAQSIGRTLQRIRTKMTARMRTDVEKFFSKLADTVVSRTDAEKSKKSGGLPSVEDLLAGNVYDELGNIFKRYYAGILEASWETWNTALDVELAFDLGDPTVVKVLKMAGSRVKDIEDTTRGALAEALARAAEKGWGIDDLVRGDPENGIPGLRDLIEETYKGRPQTIARTELGEAQNAATVSRYKEAGVQAVEILDGGSDDDDKACNEANGKIWTLALFARYILQHPNCTRAAAPYFGDEEPMTDWPYEFGDHG